VRAPGVKHTLLAMQLKLGAAGDGVEAKIGSMCTVPVKVDVGWREGVEGACEERIRSMVCG
jgi:hypothetical protein